MMTAATTTMTRRHNDHDRRPDDRDHRHDNRPEGSRGRQNHRRRPNSSVNTINAHAMHYAKLMDGPCPIHKGAKHTMGECKGLNKASREEDRKRPRQKDDELG
jgi:hypothetical protein